jgi:hypothetical protein
LSVQNPVTAYRVGTNGPGPSHLERVTGIEPALSAWELDCHVSLTIVSQVRPDLRLSVGNRQVPFLTPPSGTQRGRWLNKRFQATETIYCKQIRPVITGGAEVMDRLFPRDSPDAEPEAPDA